MHTSWKTIWGETHVPKVMCMIFVVCGGSVIPMPAPSQKHGFSFRILWVYTSTKINNSPFYQLISLLFCYRNWKLIIETNDGKFILSLF